MKIFERTSQLRYRAFQALTFPSEIRKSFNKNGGNNNILLMGAAFLAQPHTDTSVQQVEFGVPGNKVPGNKVPGKPVEISFGPQTDSLEEYVRTEQTQEDEQPTQILLDRKMIVSTGSDFPFTPENTDGIVAGSLLEVPLSLSWYGDTLQANGEALGTDPFSNAIRTIVTDTSIPNDTQVIAVITFGELSRNSAQVIVRYEASVEIHYTNIDENQTGRVLEQPTLSYLGENNEVITVRGLKVAAGTNSSLLLLDPTREDIAQWLTNMGISIDSKFVAVQVVTTTIGETVLIAVFENPESAIILERNTFNATGINARRNPSASSELVFTITSDMSTVAVSPLSLEALSESARLAEDNTNIALAYDYTNGLMQTVSENGILFTYVSITPPNGNPSYVWVATNSGSNTGYATYISFEDPFSPTQNPEVVAVPAPTAPRTTVEENRGTPTEEPTENEEEWFSTPLGTSDIVPTAVPTETEVFNPRFSETSPAVSFDVITVSGIGTDPIMVGPTEITTWIVVAWQTENDRQYAIVPLSAYRDGRFYLFMPNGTDLSFGVPPQEERVSYWRATADTLDFASTETVDTATEIDSTIGSGRKYTIRFDHPNEVNYQANFFTNAFTYVPIYSEPELQNFASSGYTSAFADTLSFEGIPVLIPTILNPIED